MTSISTAETAEKLPPELAALDAQFLSLQAERVTGPYEAGVESLIAGYLERLKKLIAEEKAAGHLDGVVALDAEQEQVVFKSAVPETNEEAHLQISKRCGRSFATPGRSSSRPVRRI